MADIKNYRKYDSWMEVPVSKNKALDLYTSIDVHEELWSIIKSVSEVKESGIKLIAKHGIGGSLKQEKIFKEFRAFIRQGENYFRSAINLSYRSSALLYYYSFLNLAKAYIKLKQPDIPNRINHGLSPKITTTNTDLSKQFVSISNNRDVFPRLYEIEGNSSRRINKLNISQLLSYAEDISHQYESAKFGKSRIFSCYLKILGNKEKNEWWTLIGIPKKADIDKYKKSFDNFFKSFDFLDIPEGSELSRFRIEIKRNFNIDPWEAIEFNFYQNKEVIKMPDDSVPWYKLVCKIYDIFSNNISEKYFRYPYDFCLNLPYRLNNQIVINEFLAIYVIMFFLSSLVRYNPDYLEDIFESKDAWLIESFVKSCPLKFLRIITSKILGETYIISRY